uniref:Lipocalin n=1 Tax=Rhipicephalus appendiculatus TaxID=34631 RepID=A0A131YEU5_RHIAP
MVEIYSLLSFCCLDCGKTHTMKTLCYLLLLANFWVMCFCNKGPGYGVTHDYSLMGKRVRNLLQRTEYIRVADGMYSRRDYPRCVRSHFHDTTMSGFKHALSYIPMTPPGSKGNTERIYRKTLFKVKPEKPPLLVVKAYVDNFQKRILKKKDYTNLDLAVSGRYNILHAENDCFVVATMQQYNVPPKRNITALGISGNSQCLLWRRAAGTVEEHKACISAFTKICRTYKGHETMYKKETCA